MDDFTRIKIDRVLANKYLESKYYNQNISLTQLLNTLLDTYLDGRLINLNDNNFYQVSECAKTLNKTNDEIVNYVLDRLEIVPVVVDTKIRLDVHKESKKVSIKKINTITNW